MNRCQKHHPGAHPDLWRAGQSSLRSLSVRKSSALWTARSRLASIRPRWRPAIGSPMYVWYSPRSSRPRRRDPERPAIYRHVILPARRRMHLAAVQLPADDRAMPRFDYGEHMWAVAVSRISGTVSPRHQDNAARPMAASRDLQQRNPGHDLQLP